jgi:sterol desaturase/sphingolipid hydroxylase (fatty acid hydroxylase superfamily)
VNRQALDTILAELHLDSGATTGLVFLPSYLLISALLLWNERRRAGGQSDGRPSSFWASVFSRDVYLHPSAILDLRLLLCNGLVAVAAGLLGLGSAFKFTGFLAMLQHGTQNLTFGALPHPTGTGPLFELSGVWVNVLFTICLALAHDFGRVVVHYAMHKVPALWEIHKYHHNAETLTPFTTYRFHPTELALTSLSVGVSIGLCIRVFQLLFGTQNLSMVMLFGMSVVTIFTHVLGVFEHGNRWFSLGRLGFIFASPANHLVHHSIEARHRDKNFANHFAIFDLLLGTLYLPKQEEHFVIGVVEQDGTRLVTRSLLRQFLLDPIVEAARAAVGRPARAAAPPAGSVVLAATERYCWCGPSCPVLANPNRAATQESAAWTRLADLWETESMPAPAALAAETIMEPEQRRETGS